MAYIKVEGPPIWLQEVVNDPRVEVGRYTYFGQRMILALWHPDERIQIGQFCAVATDVTIFAGGNHKLNRATTYPFAHLSDLAQLMEYDGELSGPTVIGNDVCLGSGATILAGVHIGDGAVIGAKAVVAKDIPPYAIAVGNPVQVLRLRFREDTVQRLLDLAWWNWESEQILTNLDLLYANPDEWPEHICWRTSSPEGISFPARQFQSGGG